MTSVLAMQGGPPVKCTFFDLLTTMGDGQWALVWQIISHLTQRETMNFVVATAPAYSRSVRNKGVLSFLRNIPTQLYVMRCLDITHPIGERRVIRMDTGSVLLPDNLRARQADILEDLLPVEVDIHVEDVNSNPIRLTTLSWRVVNSFNDTGATAHVANFKGPACLLFSRDVLAQTVPNPMPQFMLQLTACMLDVSNVTFPAGTLCDFDLSVAANLIMLTVKFSCKTKHYSGGMQRLIEPDDINVRGATKLKILEYTIGRRVASAPGSMQKLNGRSLPPTLDQVTVQGLFLSGNFFARDAPAKCVQIIRCFCDETLCIYARRLRVRWPYLHHRTSGDGRPVRAVHLNAAVGASAQYAAHLSIEGNNYQEMLSNPFVHATPAMFANLSVIKYQHVLVSQALITASCGPNVTSLTIDGCQLHSPCQRIVTIPATVRASTIANSQGEFPVADISSILNSVGPQQSVRLAVKGTTRIVHNDIAFGGFSLHCTNITFADKCVLGAKRVVLDNVGGSNVDVSKAAEIVLRGNNPLTFCDLELVPHVVVTVDTEAARQYLTQCFDTHLRSTTQFMVSIVLTTINHNPLRCYFEVLLAALSCSGDGVGISKTLQHMGDLVSNGYMLAMHAMYGKQWATFSELLDNAAFPPTRWSTIIEYNNARTGHSGTTTLDCIAFDKLEMFNRGRWQHAPCVAMCELVRENAGLSMALSVANGERGPENAKRARYDLTA